MAEGFTGVVLAGGRSSRMGRDKAMLDFRGRPLLDHMLALLEQAGARETLVSGDRAGYRCVRDEVPGEGPVGGIAAVIDGYAGPCLFVPVDMPLLTPGLLRSLVSALHDATSARFTGHILPWAVLVDDAARNAVHRSAAARGPSRSVHAMQAAIGVIDIAVEEDGAFLNLNTPDDWRAASP